MKLITFRIGSPSLYILIIITTGLSYISAYKKY